MNIKCVVCVVSVSMAVCSVEAQFGDFLKKVVAPAGNAQQETSTSQEAKAPESAKPAENACPQCNGKGTIAKGFKTKKCKACGGTGIVQQKEKEETPDVKPATRKRQTGVKKDRVSELEDSVDPDDVAFAVDAEIDDFKVAMSENKDCLVIDVREPDEFASGHIKGAINIPVGQIANRIGSVCKDKDRDIYIYCQSGKRSRTAANKLVKRGYTMVHNVVDGLNAWNGPLVK